VTVWTRSTVLGRPLTAAIALLTILCFVSGCLSTRPGPGKRLARYHPETTHRSPWIWTESGTAAAAGPGPVMRGIHQAQTNTAGVGVPPEGSSGTMTRVLKRGDKVVIALRDIPVPDEIKDEVDAGGTVNLPLIGIVKLEGKTTAEAEDLIEKMYIEGDYYRKISAIVMAEEDEYFVQGEVKREGRYPLTRDLSLLRAIVTAGGYTDFAKKSQVKVIRGNEVLTVDTNKIEERKEKDPLIKPGDIIVVPRKIFL